MQRSDGEPDSATAEEGRGRCRQRGPPRSGPVPGRAGNRVPDGDIHGLAPVQYLGYSSRVRATAKSSATG